MKTIKEIIVIILCCISVSCISHKNMTGNKHRLVYNINGVKIRNIDRRKLNEILIKDSIKFYGVPSDSTFILYISEDSKLFAAKKTEDVTLNFPFGKRYTEIKGIYGGADFGHRLLSCDSISRGQDWIYAIEYTDRPQKYGKIIRIRIESNKGKMGITTDVDHRETAIGLMNAFTMELMNVTLNLKPYKK